ncbi:MAG TPA: hypothetical protein VN779_15135 [Actinocrinis sp.]|nr:hypothetical protein [Actinocrinis sp.]
MRGESEVWRALGRLTPTERRICTAFPTGAEVDLRAGDARIDDPASAEDWPANRTVRAEGGHVRSGNTRQNRQIRARPAATRVLSTHHRPPL